MKISGPITQTIILWRTSALICSRERMNMDVQESVQSCKYASIRLPLTMADFSIPVFFIMTWILKDDESSPGFAECLAFKNGLQNAEMNIVGNQARPWLSTVSFNLFRHYTQTNTYMIRKVLIIGKLGRSDMFKFRVAIKLSLIQNLICEK